MSRHKPTLNADFRPMMVDVSGIDYGEWYPLFVWVRLEDDGTVSASSQMILGNVDLTSLPTRHSGADHE